MFDDICNTLESPPAECQKYVGDQTVFEREVSMQWSTLVLVVTGGLVVFSLVVLTLVVSFVCTVGT